MSADYTYANARIRAKESKLLSKHDLDRLLAAKDYEEVYRILLEKGWGEEDGKPLTPDELLKLEEEKTWSIINELAQDPNDFNVFRYQSDFHNLKVVIKSITRDSDPTDMMLNSGLVNGEKMYNLIKNREYKALPEYLSAVAEKAMSTILQTSDGQACDMIIDKACLESIAEIAKNSDEEILKLYAEEIVAVANIKTAVRCYKTGKSFDFIKRSLSECSTLNVSMLAKAAAKSIDDIISYLSSTEYKGAMQSLQTSMSAFEKWCDNRVMDQMKPQKWEPFSIGPLVAFIFARETELKSVRLIISCIQNNLDKEIIKERLRDTYV